jgi:tRNA A-37 threonylcarbamoyl transferase component Bud32
MKKGVFIDGDVVRKYFRPKWLRRHPNSMRREVHWLKKMESFDRTPNLISYDYEKRVVVMNYMGELLTKKNIPSDYEKQVVYILNELKRYGCAHNDIKPSELLVSEGKINIIDFAWSTDLGQTIPSHWPRRLGDKKFRFKPHEFDDEYSFRKSIKWILNH